MKTRAGRDRTHDILRLGIHFKRYEHSDAEDGMKRGWMIACLGALLLVGAACSEDDPVQPREPCPPVDNPIPNLELKDLDGKVYDIRADHCNQMVLIDFGTTWCRPCGYVSYFWDARTIPTYVLISIEGEEIFRMVGHNETRMEMLKAEIKSYLDS